MRSGNPHSGIYEAETTRTLDASIPTPQKNQGGTMIVSGRACGDVNAFNFELWSGEVKNVSPNIGACRAGDTMVYEDASPICSVPTTVRMREGCAGGGKGPLISPDVSLTLAAHNDQALFGVDCYNQQLTGDVSKTFTARSADADKVPCITNRVTDSRRLSVETFSVRRLTPLECERLMGFPDGHTVPSFAMSDLNDDLVEYFWRVHSVWATLNNVRKPKTPKQIRAWLLRICNAATCPDAPRYKACGNSMCVNVMMWLGCRLLMVESLLEQARDTM